MEGQELMLNVLAKVATPEWGVKNQLSVPQPRSQLQMEVQQFMLDPTAKMAISEWEGSRTKLVIASN